MAKTNAQRQQEYRARKKQERESGPNVAEVLGSVQLGQGTHFDEDAWWRSVAGVMSQGVACRVIAIPGESFTEYDARVRAAAGAGPWELEADETMKRRIQLHRKIGLNAHVQRAQAAVAQPMRV